MSTVAPHPLQHIADLLVTQDNLATRDPVFTVQRRNRVYGIDVTYVEDDQIVWVNEDYHELEGQEAKDLEDEFQRTETAPDCYTRTAYTDHWEIVMTFFTQLAADTYIARNSHRHDGPLRVYVDSAYRNDEWQAIRAYLLSIAKTP